ncbi:hypothetical protein [Mycobacteroides abscessus]|uniref:hypothetical protein n=1 Tax=Mycobacteroides abscessus TaxID=36809 RepID=UPI0009A77CC2|nr:hypothetical protein [Mycobacteroides abscessus]SLC86610.1 Uncharacterised protein [Mycobacteroides abscessus subsp. abscessus]SLG75754.1 Uncharacterised protein [Mycobacteroides abscessus subsp. abscessus]
MSAFLVDPEHINVLIHAGLPRQYPNIGLRWYYRDANNQEHYERLDYDTADRVGQMLLDANAASVNHRYDENEMYIYSYAQPQHTNWSPVEVLKAIHCYQYQACEPDDWKTSEAHAFCDALTHYVINKTPGYDQAPWAITTSSTPASSTQPAG